MAQRRSTNARLSDDMVERSVYLERYKRGALVRVLNLLSRLEEELVNSVQRLDPSAVGTRYREARTVRLIADVQGRIDAYSAALQEDVLPELTGLARDESQFGVRLLGDVPPVVLDVVAPSLATLTAAVMTRPFQGSLLREWLSAHPAAVRSRVRGAIRMGVAQGETVDQMVRRLRGTKANGYRDGVMEVNRRGAEAMVRTAVNHVVTAAREITYSENEDIISGVQWVSVLDGRTTVICMGLDGQVFPMNEGPRPPAHINCRSTTVPVLKSWEELGIDLTEAPEGTRASMDGQVAESLTYEEWLRTRDEGFQDEVLGKTKARLWRDGGASLDQFSDASGHIYTLDELRRRQPDVFRRAGLD